MKTLSCVLATAVMGLSQVAARTMQITDITGSGIADAYVYFLAQQNNKPITPLPVQTDADGFFEVPAPLATDLSVTVKAEDFVTTSFLQIGAEDGVLQLHRADPRTFIQISGETTGFGNLPKDGQVDFSLVYPALSRRDLLNFDMTAIISTEMDTVKVAMQKVQMPSNLTLPKQRESYIIPITLQKPHYRMFVRRPGTYQMMATHGQFPLQKVMSDMQGGKSIFEVINHFKFLQAGDREVTVTADTAGHDINVSAMPFQSETSITAPALVGQERMVTATLANKNGMFFPTDVKSISSEATQVLKIPAASDAFLVSMLTLERPKPMPAPERMNAKAFFAQSLEQVFGVFTSKGLFQTPEPEEVDPGAPVSLALQRNRSAAAPTFLSLVQAPRLEGEKLILNRPLARAGITQVATYLTLAEIEYVQNGNHRTEKRFRLWELFQPGWVSEVQLPATDIVLDPAKSYRWEVMYLGRSLEILDDGGYFLDNVTHVSRNSHSL